MNEWLIWYLSCEGNRRWYTQKCPDDWEEWQVRESIAIGGCGDDVSEIISVEKAD